MDHFLERLIYRSDPTGNLRADMDAILPVAIWANARHRVTGVLASVHGQYVQVLEGPPAKLDGLLKCLYGDPRHRNLIVLDRRRVPARLFPGWSMARAHLAPTELPCDEAKLALQLTYHLADMFRRGETRVA